MEINGKILIASDIHGRTLKVEYLLDAIERENPDHIIILGDFLYNGPRNGVPNDYEPMVVAKMLNPFKDKIIGIEGNCDSRIDHMILKFPIHPILEMTINGKKCLLIHGDDASLSWIKKSDIDICLFGHTHYHQYNQSGSLAFINPGSIGFPKDKTPGTYAIWDNGTISFYEIEEGKLLQSHNL